MKIPSSNSGITESAHAFSSLLLILGERSPLSCSPSETRRLRMREPPRLLCVYTHDFPLLMQFEHSGFPSHRVRDARHSKHASFTGGTANFFLTGFAGFVAELTLVLSDQMSVEKSKFIIVRLSGAPRNRTNVRKAIQNIR